MCFLYVFPSPHHYPTSHSQGGDEFDFYIIIINIISETEGGKKEREKGGERKGGKKGEEGKMGGEAKEREKGGAKER
jgi:hypothetical protein